MKLYSVDNKEWQIGKHKVFLRSCAHEPLEDSRNQILNSRAIQIQRTWRGYVVRKGNILLYN